MLIAYEPETGRIVYNSGTNSALPEGPDADVAHIVTGRDNLALLRLHDVTDADLVAATATHRVEIRDGRLVVGELLPVEPVQPPPDLQEWAAAAQAELTAQRAILDLLLLGGLDDDGGTIDGEIGSDLPDSGGTLDDLEGLDLGTLPDSGETLDNLDLALEG